MRWQRIALGLFLPALLGAMEPTGRPDQGPKPKVQVEPEYPANLKAQRITGFVNLAAVIDESGNVKNLVVQRASREEFGLAAAAAVAQWKYQPATKGGNVCAVRVEIPVGFVPSEADLAELDARRNKEVLPPGPPELTVAQLDEWPKLKKEIRPETPEVLVKNRRIGEAGIAFIVDEEGRPRDVHAVLSTDAECSVAAETVIKSWQFVPGRKDGRPVRVPLEVTIVFFPEQHWANGVRVRPGVKTFIDKGERNKPERKDLEPPKPVKKLDVEFPEEMGVRGLTGDITVDMIIDSSGMVTHVAPVGQNNEFFAVMVERAVSYWRFRPAKVNGVPVTSLARQRVEFGY